MGRYIAKVMDGMIMGAGYLGSGLIIVAMLMVTYDVVLRYIFNRPTVWAVTLSGSMLIWSILLVAPWVLRQEAHIKMDIVLERLHPKRQAFINCITGILAIASCIIILWKGIAATRDAVVRGTTESVGIFALPSWIVLLAIPVGMFLVIWQSVERFVSHLAHFRALSKGKSENSSYPGEDHHQKA